MGEPINRKQAFAARLYEEYWERPYLKEATDEEIVQRMRDLIANICTLTSDGKIGAVPPDSEDGLFLWRLFSHALEESRRRTGDPRGLMKRYGITDAAIVRPTFPDPPAGTQAAALATRVSRERCLYRFTTAEYGYELLAKGRLRLAPASYYKDPSLALAVQDDELSYEVSSRFFESDIRNLNPFEVRLSEAFGSIERVSLKVEIPTNYYVWCASFRYDPRMFDDFAADAVVVIHEPGIFFKRMVGALRRVLPGWQVSPCAVAYFDPWHPTASTQSVFRSKHFRYLYQKELRMVFLPPSPAVTLDPIMLELGPTNDLISLVPRW